MELVDEDVAKRRQRWVWKIPHGGRVPPMVVVGAGLAKRGPLRFEDLGYPSLLMAVGETSPLAMRSGRRSEGGVLRPEIS